MTVSASRFLAGLIIAAFGVLVLFFWPYFSVFVLAIVFGVIFDPLYRRFLRHMRPSSASLLTTAVIVLIILCPLIFVAVDLFAEAGGVLARLQSTNSFGTTFTT